MSRLLVYLLSADGGVLGGIFSGKRGMNFITIFQQGNGENAF